MLAFRAFDGHRASRRCVLAIWITIAAVKRVSSSGAPLYQFAVAIWALNAGGFVLNVRAAWGLGALGLPAAATDEKLAPPVLFSHQWLAAFWTVLPGWLRLEGFWYLTILL